MRKSLPRLFVLLHPPKTFMVLMSNELTPEEVASTIASDVRTTVNDLYDTKITDLKSK